MDCLFRRGEPSIVAKIPPFGKGEPKEAVAVRRLELLDLRWLMQSPLQPSPRQESSGGLLLTFPLLFESILSGIPSESNLEGPPIEF